jgi:hypothetical protein
MARNGQVRMISRGRGRPRLNNVRIECMVPREVYDQLVKVESSTEVYRTRVAAAVLCEWANATRAGGYSPQTVNHWAQPQA